MTKVVTPAFIAYTPSNGVQQTIKFHSVLAEAHMASAEVTQFPVQTGFMISNNVIRKNRQITITGMITNNLIEGGATAYEYSSNNSKTIFEALEALIGSGQTCEVTTNLGVYSPVVFTRFSTKQMQGLTDAIVFDISGDEVQVAGALRNQVPSVLSFKPLNEQAKADRLAWFEDQGLEVCECNTVSEAQFTLGSAFAINDVNNAGTPVTTTYTPRSRDPVTGEWVYDIHSSDTELFTPDNVYVPPYLPNVDGTREKRQAGFAGALDCIGGSIVEVARDAAVDYIETAMGELRETIHGVVYDTVNLSDNKYAQAIIQAGIGCLVRGVTGVSSDFPYVPGEALPTAEEVVDKAIQWGKDKFSPIIGSVTTRDPAAQKSTITKIDCCKK